jgi:hypothetical protein
MSNKPVQIDPYANRREFVIEERRCLCGGSLAQIYLLNNRRIEQPPRPDLPCGLS